MQVLGLDIGYGFTKCTDGRRQQIFKSVLGEPSEVQFTESLVEDGTPTPRHIELDGEAWFVGELAELQSRGRSFTLDPQQFVSRHALPLALAAIAPLVADGEPVRLVTGLPISFFRRQRGELTALLNKRHRVILIDAAGNRSERNIPVDRVKVIPQPFGSLFHLVLDDSGRPVGQNLLKEKVGIIDVGFRTADYTISDRTRYLERGSASSDSGISTAFAAIANVLQEKSGVNVELYRLYEAVDRGSIKIRGKRYDLTRMVERALAQLAQKIATEANRLWADDWDIDAIVLTGGGGALLAPHLTPLLEGEVLPVPADSDARLNNVRGYFKYGQHLWGAAARAGQPAPG